MYKNRLRGIRYHAVLSVSVPKEFLALIDDLASKTGKTRSRVVQEALLYYFKNKLELENESKPQLQEELVKKPKPPIKENPKPSQVKIKSPDSFWE